MFMQKEHGWSFMVQQAYILSQAVQCIFQIIVL